MNLFNFVRYLPGLAMILFTKISGLLQRALFLYFWGILIYNYSKGGDTLMKKILWISRHILSDAQWAGLERLCGETFELIWWKENVEDLAVLAPAVAAADVIAAVLPVHLLARLVAMADGKPVLIDLARRTLVSCDGPEDATLFAHGGWQRIRRLELELEPLE